MNHKSLHSLVSPDEQSYSFYLFIFEFLNFILFYFIFYTAGSY